MFESGVVLSVKPDAASDYLVVRAIAAGCRPVLPDGGMYPEIIPSELQQSCLYEISPNGLTYREWLTQIADRVRAATDER